MKDCFDHIRGTGGEFGDVVLGWRDVRALFLRRRVWAIRESSARDLGARREGRRTDVSICNWQAEAVTWSKEGDSERSASPYLTLHN